MMSLPGRRTLTVITMHVCILVASCGEESPPQPPFVVEWSAAITSSPAQLARSLARSADGGFFVAGSFFDAENVWTCRWEDFLGTEYEATCTKNDSLFVQKRTAGGGVEWEKRWGDPNSSLTIQDVATQGATLFVVGTFEGSVTLGDAVLQSDERDLFVARLGSSGQVLWSRQLGGDFDEISAAVAVGEDGSVCLVGNSQHIYGGGIEPPDFFVARFDSDGTQLWLRDFSTPPYELGTSIRSLPSGNVAVGGSYSAELNLNSDEVLPVHGRQSAMLIEITPDGDATSLLDFGGGTDDSIAAFDVTPENDLVVLAHVSPDHDLPFIEKHNGGYLRPALVQMSTDGQVRNAELLDDSLCGLARLLVVDGSGGITVGSVKTRQSSGLDVCLAHRSDPNRWPWQWSPTQTGIDVIHDVMALPDGSLVVAGQLEGELYLGDHALSASTLQDGFLIRLRP